jgi:TRAP-type uncharacterized transport system fused permease subunit
MTLVEFMPWLAGVSAVAFVLTVALRQPDAGSRKAWMLPAMLSIAFLSWSVSAIMVEGPVGFWREHTRNMWSNQIWLDLLLSVSIGWYLLVPQAKALRMKVLAWALLIVCTGSIGFLAMISRYLFLQEKLELQKRH